MVLVAGGGLAGRALGNGSDQPGQQITRNSAVGTTIAPALAACITTMKNATYLSTTTVNGVDLALFLNVNKSLLAVRIADCTEIASLDISSTTP